MTFPYEPMEVVERRGYEETPYLLIQTKAERDGWEVAEIRPDIPNQRKVANLLAAAPDLLEALEELERSVLAGSYEDPSHDRIFRALKDARAAIARARGEA